MSGTEYRYSDLDASHDTHGLLRHFFLRGVGAFVNWFLHAIPFLACSAAPCTAGIIYSMYARRSLMIIDLHFSLILRRHLFLIYVAQHSSAGSIRGELSANLQRKQS